MLDHIDDAYEFGISFPQGKEDAMKIEVVYPCYGGPKDGAFFPREKKPLGYKEFSCRGRMLWLWKPIKPEYLDFNTLQRASRMLPSAFDNSEDCK